ncbi:LysR family transcriptional regulator [Vibrio sp. SS-MA-C1-2]|uniref:LysR family transcriptional regulator n=1 Tax=Vibrio sp. SS-MA-C1-2 TaxID=2908646 RepID=UPI001F2B47FD|nr:LysR family transcriptional regulator [Vibrio sp. SS-MA-C1-2]UJF18718.1 LysR family transcriptional regulator [Vibrio sp. SS-MA-C1-2]
MVKNTLDDFYLFCQVVKYGSMKKVSELTGLPMSTISRRISNLESSTKTTLLIRAKNKIYPTNDGKRFYEQIGDKAEMFYQSIDNLKKDMGEISGTVVLSIPSAFYAYHLNKHIVKLLLKHPELIIKIQTPENPNQIKDNVDIALTIGELKDSNLIARTLLNVGISAVASPEFIEQNLEEIENNHIEQLPYISTWVDPTLYIKEQDTDEIIKIIPNTKLVLGTLDLIYEALEMSVGFSTVPTHLLPDNSKLEVIPSIRIPKIQASLMYRSRNSQSAAQQLVIKTILDIFKDIKLD